MNIRLLTNWSAVLCCCYASIALGGSSFGINGARISSGGGQSVGGQFVLTGTIAQPVVSAGATGGTFAVTSGFWTEQREGLVITSGDLNCDSDVDAGDVVPFVLALLDSAGYAINYPSCDRNNADTNDDGRVDGADIDGFLQALITAR